MNTLLFKNLFSVCMPALLAVALSLILNHFTVLPSVNWKYSLYFLFPFCLLLNCIYSTRYSHENFTQLLIVAIVIKLLLALTAIVIYSFIDKVGFFNFSLHFISHYILFTIFEIRYLLYLIKKNQAHV